MKSSSERKGLDTPLLADQPQQFEARLLSDNLVIFDSDVNCKEMDDRYARQPTETEDQLFSDRTQYTLTKPP